MKVFAIALSLFAFFGIASCEGQLMGDALRDEFMAFSNKKNPPKVSSCVFDALEAAHGREFIRKWLDVAPTVEGQEVPSAEAMAIGMKVLPVAFACIPDLMRAAGDSPASEIDTTTSSLLAALADSSAPETDAAASALLREARDLERKKKWSAALAKYNEVLELNGEMAEAREGLERTRSEIAAFREKQSYLDNVALYDLKAKYYRTYSEEKVPGVEFKLKNKGERTLDEVEVTVYFKDASGTIIAEETYHPVLVSQFSFGDNKPLRAKYVWQLERGKFHKAESVPSEWKEGAVSAKITDIEFGES